MKKLTYLLAALAVPVLFSACKSEDKEVTPTISFEQESVVASPEGGSYTANLLCNTSWEVTAQSTNITNLNLKKGSGNAALTFDVSAKTGEVNTQGYITVKTTAGVPALTKTLTVTQEAVRVILTPTEYEVPAEGGTLEVQLSSNVTWKVTAVAGIEKGVTLGQTGTGAANFNLTFGENDTEDALVYSFTVAWVGGDVDATFTATQGQPSLVYEGVTYKISKMKDGRWWMAENLRFIPKGVTVSGDPTEESAMWYTADLSKQPLKDAASIEKNGYFYNTTLALTKGEVITETNYQSFEGDQGICPEGWYIPTTDDANQLIAAYHDEKQDPSGSQAASIAALDADNFNVLLVGTRMKNTSIQTGAYAPGTAAVSNAFIMLSTGKSYTVNASTGAITSKNQAMMFMKNASYERLTIAEASTYAGLSVRCIREKAK